MGDLLTAHEVQSLLKVDRTTVYRMLKDGRLTGVKIGQQWRFPREEVDALLAGSPAVEEPSAPPRDILPLHCVQPIQDVFSEIGGISVVTTAPDGEPLTQPSNPCTFCALIQSSPSGRQACIASWRRLAEQSERRPVFAACHAGLHEASAVQRAIGLDVDSALATLRLSLGRWSTAADVDDAAELLARAAR